MLPQLEQIKQFTAVQPEQCFVDRGYRGHKVKDTKVFISGQKRDVTRSIKKALKRRSAIEPEIGHMKNDGRLDRCYLKGTVGDAIIRAENELGSTSFLRVAREITLTHHEKWDGSSYPYGLKGNKIPVNLILKQKGRHFDPDIVDAFEVLQSAFKNIAEKFKD